MSARRRPSIVMAGFVMAVALVRVGTADDRFEEPVPIRVDGRVLEFTDRAVYPALGDWDADGRRDLLVGHNSGRMRVFRNLGTDDRPEFTDPVWFDEMMAEGRIPTG